MTPPVLGTALDGLQFSLVQTHVSGSGKLQLKPGAGAEILSRIATQGAAAISADHPAFVNVVPAANLNPLTGLVKEWTGCVVFTATRLVGDALTVAPTYPNTDTSIVAGAVVVFGTMAKLVDDLNAAVLATISALDAKANLASPQFAGVPALSGSPLATQAWVASQGYSTGGDGGGGGGGGVILTTGTGRGPLWLNVQDFGARPDSGTTDNTPAFQAAVDHARTLIPGGSSTSVAIYVPGATGSYQLKSGSVWVDWPGIGFAGDGRGNTTVFNLSGHPAFIFGVPREQVVDGAGTLGTLAGTASYRPDCHGKLDASAAPTTGARCGLRTNHDAAVQIINSPLSEGAGVLADVVRSEKWTETTKLTFEFCIEPPDGESLPAGFDLLGIGNGVAEPSPIVFVMGDNNKLYCGFRTAEMLDGANQPNRSFRIDLTGASLPYRITVQVDLDNAAVSAFLGSTQVALDAPDNLSSGSAVPFGPGLHFPCNDHFPFMVGATGLMLSYTGAIALDLRLYGLRLSNTLRYQANGVGTPQVRADSPATALNDLWRYFGSDAHTIAYLPGTDNPTTSGRVVTVAHGGACNTGPTSGVIMHTYGGLGPRAGNNHFIREMTIHGAGGGYGDVVQIGHVFGFAFENVTIEGGYHAIGCFPISSTYYVYLLGVVRLSGADGGYQGIQQFVTNEGGLEFPDSGRVAMRFSGCRTNLSHVFVSGPQAITEGVVKYKDWGYGGNHSLEDMEVDYEGYSITGSVIYCEAHYNCPCTSLMLKDIILGTVGPTANLIRLRDIGTLGGALKQAYLFAHNIILHQDAYGSTVDLDGPLWWGEVKAGYIPDANQITNSHRWGSGTNVVFTTQKP